MRALPLLLLCACATPRGPWTVKGAEWDVQAWADAAARVSGDGRGHLAAGGVVQVFTGPYATDIPCRAPEGMHYSGCAGRGFVKVLVWPPRWGPGPQTTALAHEFCEIGLERYEGPWRSIRFPSEAESDACALLVRQAVLP
jgi:hypothetical protein